MLSVILLASMSLAAPAEWRCWPDLYQDGYSCDCGCGLVDPDCRYADGALFDFAACTSHNCAAGTVPLQGAPGACVPNVCGDSFVDKDEVCDDGDGPGCDSTCQEVAEGYRCSGLGGGCGVPRCGDGVVDAELGERCDDGNDSDGDGCVACVPQSGFVCRMFGGCVATTCGDGIIDWDWDTQTGEGCEDNDFLSGDGCDERCQAEAGWVCNWDGCFRVVCGDGVVVRGDFGSGEQCDDGNVELGDGCDGECFIEAGWTCDDWLGCQEAICGDRVVQPTELCDDGNSDDGDGCDASCQSEPGWSCFNIDGVCTPVICGDGKVMADDAGSIYEECDDSNGEDGDGCDAQCHRERGFVCLEDGSCRPIVCGDGYIDRDEGGGFPGFPHEPDGPKKVPLPVDPGGDDPGGPGGPGEPIPGNDQEDCDDGNDVAGDGCSAVCTVEDGFVCEVPGSLCIFPVCSDGLVQGAETCDDGNDIAGDGCSNGCKREPGYVCREAGRACEPMPAAWVCSAIIYGSGDGCDCGCGARDPDCAESADASACRFNHCLEDAPYPTADDPTQCGTEAPVEVSPEVVETPVEEGPVETEVEVPPEAVESEPTTPRASDDGCAGGGMSLLGLLALVRRRRPARARQAKAQDHA